MQRGYDRGTSLVFGFLLGVPLVVALPTVLPVLEAIGWVIATVIGLALLIIIPLSIARWSRKNARERRHFVLGEKAIGVSKNSSVADSASLIEGGTMAYDSRLVLVDTDGDERFAAIIDGTFQIGKGRDQLPTSIEAFAKAILIDEKDGRFVCSDGRKPGILKFSGRAREARSYRLDAAIAAKIGIPAHGTR